ncbi:MAG: glycosyltransferase [Candidatus Krumholzibacteriota bacterium]|nr:glycosyltransferase [Candidatus Krumholzibacteriota bacterium]
MDLSIVIVTYNSKNVIGKCISSLKEYSPSCNYEIIVIDNASKDGTPEFVSSEFNNVRVEANSRNKGYSGGVNQGVSLSKGRMVLILNPDIVVREKSIDRLFDFMEKTPDAAMVGSKLLNSDGSLQYSCRSFYTIKALFLRRTFLGKLFPRAKSLRRHLMLDYDHQKTRRVDWILGACMMVRAEVIEKIGMMDERFFLYFEDVDWCYRIKQFGWNVYYLPRSVMTHLYMRSSSRSMFRKPFLIHLLSLLKYYDKWNVVFYFFKRHRAMLKSLTFVIVDILAINASFFLAYWLRAIADSFFAHGLYPLSWYYYFIYFYNIIFFFSFLFGKLYSIRRETSSIEEFSRIIKAVLVSLTVIMTSTYLLRIRIYSRVIILGQGVFGIIIVFTFRKLIRTVHRLFVEAGFDRKRVGLVAKREETETFLESVSSSPELGLDIAGHINYEENSLGTPDEIVEIIDRFKIHEIFIFPSFENTDIMFTLVSSNKFSTIQIRIVSPIARFLSDRVRVDNIGGDYLFSVEKGSAFQLRKWIIRVFDISLSSLLLPISTVLSLLLKLYGKCRVNISFYSERRFAGGKRRILWPRIVFESGREASDIFKPGLYFSVLKGKLSFVGAPALLAEDSITHFCSEGAYYKPGITGRWRISPTGNFPALIEEEIVALQKQSLTNYILLIFKSFLVSLSGTYPEWFYIEDGE